MENTIFRRTRLLFLATLVMLSLSASTVAPVRADGALLGGFEVPATVPFGNHVAPALYWPIGVAFDGSNLWYAQPCDCTSDIFQTTTGGVLLNTLREVKEAAALAWDGTHLWVGSFPSNAVTCTAGSTGCAFVTEVDVATGNPIKVVDVSNILAGDQECGFITGLDYDSSTESLWIAPNVGCLIGIVPDACLVGYLYNVDTSGNLIQRVPLSFGTFGVAKVGSSLYVSSCGPPSGGNRIIYKTTTGGVVLSSFSTVSVSGRREHAEDVTFDPVSFAPSCALWVVQYYNVPFDASLAAYQIDCP